MREIKGNLFKPNTYRPSIGLPDAICITTNGGWKKNGCAVMGAGVAKQARDLFPGIDKVLGDRLRTMGNIPHVLRHNEKYDTYVISFPTKPQGRRIQTYADIQWYVIERMQDKFRTGDYVPGWACKSDIVLIENSARILDAIATGSGMSTVVIPRPGCNNGELSWEKVKKVLEPILDDRFYIITL